VDPLGAPGPISFPLDTVDDGAVFMSAFDTVKTIASDLFQVPVAQLGEKSSPETLEQWDSVQHLNLVTAIEEHFSICFEPEEIDEMSDLGAIARLVEAKG
jgi:acyl carrier protein